ncbi:hypothetical protein [Streptomyces sp. NBC_01445]|nr:hypothetical protein [Streptomyces sp. NBC_01445]WSE11563.1 hypothetical protein OG574_51245 [Streptomyces sp. NBC_01445]
MPIRKRNASIPAQLTTLINDILGVEDPREGVTPSAEEFNRALKEAL